MDRHWIRICAFTLITVSLQGINNNNKPNCIGDELNVLNACCNPEQYLVYFDSANQIIKSSSAVEVVVLGRKNTKICRTCQCMTRAGTLCCN